VPLALLMLLESATFNVPIGIALDTFEEPALSLGVAFDLSHF
jgi:hypothetical protein